MEAGDATHTHQMTTPAPNGVARLKPDRLPRLETLVRGAAATPCRTAWIPLTFLVVLAVTSAESLAGEAALADAAKRRDTDAVHTLVRQGADANASLPDGTRALHWAVHWDDKEAAALLLDAGATVNTASDLGVTPLYLACLNGSAPMVEMLLIAGADANSARPTGETTLMTCARTGSVDAVVALLSRGADVSAKEKANGQTALMWAAAQDHGRVARVLIEHGADFHATTAGSGFTPLLFAARNGATDAVRELLQAGANIDQGAADGTTALVAATVLRHWKLSRFLLEQGADPNADGAGYAPLHWAAGSWETDISGKFGSEEYRWIAGLGPGKLDLVEALLAHGADPNARLRKGPPRFGYVGVIRRFNLRGSTPFLLALAGGHMRIARVLLASGADPALTADDGTTPLMAAAGLAHTVGQSLISYEEALQAVRLAAELGNDVNASNDAGDTALHAAADFGADDIVRFLVDSGADVNAANNIGSKPLTVAQATVGALRGPQESTAALLKEFGGIGDVEIEGSIASLESSCPGADFTIEAQRGGSSGSGQPGRYSRSLSVSATPTTSYIQGSCAELLRGSVLKVTGTRALVRGRIAASRIEVLH